MQEKAFVCWKEIRAKKLIYLSFLDIFFFHRYRQLLKLPLTGNVRQLHQFRDNIVKKFAVKKWLTSSVNRIQS